MAGIVGDSEKGRAAAWFAELRDQICAAFEALEDAQDSGPFAGLPAGRFERKATRRAAARRTRGGGVMAVMREGRVFEKVGVNVSTVHGRLDARGAAEPDRAQGDPGAGRGPAVLGERHQPRRAHALAADAGGAHEHADVLDARRLVVRRRRRPQPDDRGRGRHRRLPRRAEGGLRRARPGLLSAVQGLGGRLLPDPPLERAARRRRHLLRRPLHRRLGGGLRLHPGRRAGVPRRLRADHRAAHGRALDRGRARDPARQARALRRVQPRLRPRHEVRPARPGTTRRRC